MKKFLLFLLLCTAAESSFSQCYSVAQITYAPDSFTQGNFITINAEDKYSAVVQMPFSFCFFGEVHNSLVVGTNGIISFDTALANTYCPWPIVAAIPSSAMPRNAILLPMQDLYHTIPYTIYCNTYGTAPNRRFVISMSVSMYSCVSMTYVGEVRLFETTNVIETHIANKASCVQWNGGYAVHGIQNSAGTQAAVVPGRNYPLTWTATNDAWSFSPNCCPLGVPGATEDAAFTIFPNPASGEIHISYKGAAPENFAAELTDISGRIVYSDAPAAQNERILKLDVPAGIYFIRLVNDRGETLALRKLAVE